MKDIMLVLKNRWPQHKSSSQRAWDEAHPKYPSLRLAVSTFALSILIIFFLVKSANADDPMTSIQLEGNEWLNSCRTKCDLLLSNGSEDISDAVVESEARDLAYKRCSSIAEKVLEPYLKYNSTQSTIDYIRNQNKKYITQCVKEQSGLIKRDIISSIQGDAQRHSEQKRRSCNDECEIKAKQLVAEKQKQFLSEQNASTIKLSRASKETTLTELLSLAAPLIEQQKARLLYTQEFMIDNSDECKFGLNLYSPQDSIPRQWDGAWIPGSEIGQQFQVSFRSVVEQNTQSGMTDNRFVVGFYGERRNYGSINQYKIFQQSEGASFDYRLVSTEGQNLSLTGLGWFANGATFNLTFRRTDREVAIKLIKRLFAECR